MFVTGRLSTFNDALLRNWMFECMQRLDDCGSCSRHPCSLRQHWHKRLFRNWHPSIQHPLLPELSVTRVRWSWGRTFYFIFLISWIVLVYLSTVITVWAGLWMFSTCSGSEVKQTKTWIGCGQPFHWFFSVIFFLDLNMHLQSEHCFVIVVKSLSLPN